MEADWIAAALEPILLCAEDAADEAADDEAPADESATFPWLRLSLLCCSWPQLLEGGLQDSSPSPLPDRSVEVLLSSKLRARPVGPLSREVVLVMVALADALAALAAATRWAGGGLAGCLALASPPVVGSGAGVGGGRGSAAFASAFGSTPWGGALPAGRDLGAGSGSGAGAVGPLPVGAVAVGGGGGAGEPRIGGGAVGAGGGDLPREALWTCCGGIGAALSSIARSATILEASHLLQEVGRRLKSFLSNFRVFGYRRIVAQSPMLATLTGSSRGSMRSIDCSCCSLPQMSM